MAILARRRAVAALLLAVVAGRAAAVDYTDMQQWAGLLAQTFLTHSDDVGHAHSQLALFKALVTGKIADAAAGKDIYKTGDEDWRKRHPASHKLLGGAVTVYDPALYEDTSAKISNSLRGAVLAPTFFQYAPCLLFSQPYGFGMFPYGVSIQPTGIFIVPTGFNVIPQGINVAPTLIYVGPVGRNINYVGFNVVPALISVAPVYDANFTVAKDVSGLPLKIVTLPRNGSGDPVITYGGPDGVPRNEAGEPLVPMGGPGT